MPCQPSRRLLVVTALLLDQRSRVLLVRRGAGSRAFRGFWQFPEGKVELGEEPRVALRREVREELSLRLTHARLVGVTHTIGLHNGECLEIVRLVFAVKARGELHLSDEHQAYRWMPLACLARLRGLVPGTEKVCALCVAAVSAKEESHEGPALYRSQRRREVRPRRRARSAPSGAGHL